MIDTIVLHGAAGNFDVHRSNKLSSRTLANPDGEVTSVVRFRNLNHLTLEVKPERAHPDEQGLFITASLPKRVLGTSLRELRDTDLDLVRKDLEKQLQESGVEVEPGAVVERFPLYRVDLCKNLRVEHPVSDYLSLFGKFAMSRREKRDIAGEYLRYGNRSQQLVMYDKLKEVRDSERDPEVQKLVEKYRGDVLRVEYRAMHRSGVSKLCPDVEDAVTLSQVFSSQLSRGKLLAEVNNMVREGEVQFSDFTADVELLAALRKRYRSGASTRFLMARGIPSLLSDYQHDWQRIRELYQAAGFSKSQVYYLLSKMEGLHSQLLPRRERNLLREVQRKLAV